MCKALGGVIYLVGYRFSSRGYRLSSRTKIRKSIGSNQFITTSKTPKIKKCPISRANIVHFETLALYQNVSYKMVPARGFGPPTYSLRMSCSTN